GGPCALRGAPGAKTQWAHQRRLGELHARGSGGGVGGDRGAGGPTRARGVYSTKTTFSRVAERRTGSGGRRTGNGEGVRRTTPAGRSSAPPPLPAPPVGGTAPW